MRTIVIPVFEEYCRMELPRDYSIVAIIEGFDDNPHITPE